MASGGGFAFGPFHLDVRSRRLDRAGDRVHLTTLQFAVLGVLVSRAGEVISKDSLMDAAWAGVTVDENGLEQVVSQLRRILDRGDPNRYIQTVTRRGYCFAAPVTPVDDRRTDAELDAELAPYRALTDGRAAIETLERAHIARARSIFEELLRRDARAVSVHVGLANACVLQFEATRADPAPDEDALTLAVVHAREACRLDSRSGEAWATLGFVLVSAGEHADGVAALRRAVELDPHNWQHQFRLAYGSWGDERRRAAGHALAKCPRFPMAHVLAATVYVARDALAQAEVEIDAALSVIADAAAPGRLSTVAAHWLKGLLALARGAEDEALAAFEQELALEARGHLYARECCAQTWYAIGACHLRRGDTTVARAAFEQAIARVPRHPMAHAGLALLETRNDNPGQASPATSIDLALASAAPLVASGDAPAAAQIVVAALAAAPPGNGGWLIPVEPLLRVSHDRTAWTRVLDVLRERAW